MPIYIPKNSVMDFDEQTVIVLKKKMGVPFWAE